MNDVVVFQTTYVIFTTKPTFSVILYMLFSCVTIESIKIHFLIGSKMTPKSVVCMDLLESE